MIALVTYKRRELGIEYKGGFHDEAERKGADEEREAVLAQMGYRIVTLTSTQFASQLAFHRAMNNIREALGMPRCVDAATTANISSQNGIATMASEACEVTVIAAATGKMGSF